MPQPRPRCAAPVWWESGVAAAACVCGAWSPWSTAVCVCATGSQWQRLHPLRQVVRDAVASAVVVVAAVVAVVAVAAVVAAAPVATRRAGRPSPSWAAW